MSQIGFDAKSLYYGFRMVMRLTKYHKLLSCLPTNYIILGYKPNKTNQMAVTKTAFGATFFAPSIHREYALKFKDGSYHVDMEGIIKALLKYSKQPFPVRLMGFPSYTYFLLKELKQREIYVKLPKKSKILLGGGWKQFYTEKVEKEELYKIAEDVLGVNDSQIHEFFGAVEHPILYCDCRNHHFHVPVYSRVIIRDVMTVVEACHKLAINIERGAYDDTLKALKDIGLVTDEQVQAVMYMLKKETMLLKLRTELGEDFSNRKILYSDFFNLMRQEALTSIGGGSVHWCRHTTPGAGHRHAGTNHASIYN